MTIFLAVLFAILGQGAGHAYLNDLKKAGVYGGLFIAGPLFAAMVLVLLAKNGSGDGSMAAASAVTATIAVVTLVSILDALFTAIRLRKVNHDYSWKKGLVAVLVVIMGRYLMSLAVRPFVAAQ